MAGDLKMTEDLGGTVYDIPDNTNILIGTPNYTNLFSSEVHANHVHLSVQWSKWGLKFNHTIIGRTFVHFARSQMCDVAYRGDWSHLLWLDDDAVIEEHVLPKMLQHDKDIVIAPYPMRKPPYQLGILKATAHRCNDCSWYGFIIFSYEEDKVVFLDDMDHTFNGCPANDYENHCPKCNSENLWRDFHNHNSYRNMSVGHNLEQGGLMEVDGGGTHCMLVNTRVFDKRGARDGLDSMPPEVQNIIDRIKDGLTGEELENYNHYLGDLPDETQTFVEETAAGKPYFLMPKHGTEDMYFCYRAKRKGIKIYMDCDVFAAHVGFAPVITKSFRAQAEVNAFHKSERDNKSYPLESHSDQSKNVDFIEESADGELPTRSPVVRTDKTVSLV